MKRNKQNVPQEDLDHGHLPDPIHEEMDQLGQQEEQLEQKVASLEKEIKELREAITTMIQN